MLVTTHMYYAKTFIPGQFSPEYWDVKTNVLEGYDLGTAILSNTIEPKIGLDRTTSIYILAMDRGNNVKHSNYGGVLTSVLSIQPVDINKTNLEYASISGLGIEPITINLQESWSSRFLSTLSFTDDNINVSNLDYAGITGLEVGAFDLADGLAPGLSFTTIINSGIQMNTPELGWVSDSTYQNNAPDFDLLTSQVNVPEGFVFGLDSSATLEASETNVIAESISAAVYPTTVITPVSNFL